MKTDSKTVVIVLDFTKFGLVEMGNVHSFVVSLLSRGDYEAAMSGISISESYFNIVADWKPKTQYYDYVAQSTDKKPVKQVFPYVKV